MCKNCQELFCTECLNKFFQKKISCPNCKKSPFKDLDIHKSVKNNYNNIEIKCPLECSNEEKLKMDNLEKHLTVCDKRLFYKCQLCKQFFKEESERNKHKSECPEEKVKCTYCQCIIKKKDFEIHIENHCEKRLVKCVECFCVIPMDLTESHYGYICNLLSNGREKIKDMKKIFNDVVMKNTNK